MLAFVQYPSHTADIDPDIEEDLTSWAAFGTQRQDCTEVVCWPNIECFYVVDEPVEDHVAKVMVEYLVTEKVCCSQTFVFRYACVVQLFFIERQTLVSRLEKWMAVQPAAVDLERFWVVFGHFDEVCLSFLPLTIRGGLEEG